jgi:peptidoglycan/LPS O-acetylase OafA/YrhL
MTLGTGAGLSTGGRSAGLDALRTIACLLVVAFHLHTVASVPFGVLDPVIGGGDQGVYLFFALSGYLLYKPFVRGDVDLRSYAIKRLSRILPGYYIALVGLEILTRSPLPGTAPGAYLLIASSYSGPLRGFLGSAWTLSAELVFYAALPVIARLARNREAVVIAGLGAASSAWTVLLRLTGSDPSTVQLGFFPAVFYAFVPGMLLAILEVRHYATFVQLRAPLYLMLGTVLAVLGTLLHELPIAIGVGLGAPFLIGGLAQRQLPAARLLAFTGGASYALYLWHKDLLIAFGVAGLQIALAASGLSWALVEAPVLRLGHRLAASIRVQRPSLVLADLGPRLPSAPSDSSAPSSDPR